MEKVKTKEIQDSELDANEEINPEKKEILDLRDSLTKEKLLITHLAHLSVLGRLGENRHLDNLFDGEVVAGVEELLAIYGILDIANGNDRFKGLKAPQKITVDLNRWRWDHNMAINYEKLKDGTLLLDNIHYDKTGFWNEADLKLNRNNDGQIDNMIFDRPRLGWDQSIVFERDKSGKVVFIRIDQNLEVDNKLTVDYNESNQPMAIYQTKLGLLDDKMFLYYDENGGLENIVYLPAMSLKKMKSGLKGLGNAKTIKQLWVAVEKVIVDNLKLLKGNDVIQIKLKDGVPISMENFMDASNWFYSDGKASLDYDNEGQLTSEEIDQEEIFSDSKVKIKVEY